MRAPSGVAAWLQPRCWSPAGLLLLLLCRALPAAAQIRVLSPSDVVRLFNASNGRITGSTATFGAPFYGDKVFGRLVYGPSKKDQCHCTEDDYDLPLVPTTESETESKAESKVRLINIAMVKRGKCSFTKKVLVAHSKGAHAVVVVDKEDSTLTSKDMWRIIVADDGFGENIHIPSILISKEDGFKLLGAAASKTAKPIVVELSWEVPTNHVVNVDLWMSSASQQSLKFMKDFSKKRKALNSVVRFQPHYAVFSMPSSDPRVYANLCSDTTGEYCAEDPDAGGLITGQDVLEEDVRQLCIHDLSKVPRTSELTKRAGQIIEYAELYWDYVERLMDVCPLQAKIEKMRPADRFGRKCSEKLMRMVGLDVEKVNGCILDTKEQKLRHERENGAWSPRALRINGWRYSGMLDSDLVTRAICSGFIEAPPECEELLRPRSPFDIYKGAQDNRGVSFGALLGVIFAGLGVGLLAAVLYKRSVKQSVRTTLREEVMIEVQNQMNQYKQLKG